MKSDERVEAVQRCILAVLARQRAGVGLVLAGGGRYRFVDGSARLSADIDYVWNGDLSLKRDEVVRALQRTLPPELKRRFRLDSSVYALDPPGVDSMRVKTLEVATWGNDPASRRIEVPVDIVSIPCVDPPTAETVEGVVCLVASDADMVECKVLSALERNPPAARDWVDLFLFGGQAHPDAPARFSRKCIDLQLQATQVAAAYARVLASRDIVCAGIAQVLREQVEGAVADNVEQAGGAELVWTRALEVVARVSALARGVA